MPLASTPAPDSTAVTTAPVRCLCGYSIGLCLGVNPILRKIFAPSSPPDPIRQETRSHPTRPIRWDFEIDHMEKRWQTVAKPPFYRGRFWPILANPW